jgi:hypothetical protein
MFATVPVPPVMYPAHGGNQISGNPLHTSSVAGKHLVASIGYKHKIVRRAAGVLGVAVAMSVSQSPTPRAMTSTSLSPLMLAVLLGTGVAHVEKSEDMIRRVIL